MARLSPHMSRRSSGFGRGGGGGNGRRGGTSISTLMAIGAVVWIVVLLGTTARGVVKSVELTRSVANLRAESLSVAASLDTVNALLRSQNPAHEVERHAREELGLHKAGEIVYRVRHSGVVVDSGR